MFSKYVKPLLLVLAMVTSQFGIIAANEAQPGVPGSTSPINLDANGVALGGYDPVAYFEGERQRRENLRSTPRMAARATSSRRQRIGHAAYRC